MRHLLRQEFSQTSSDQLVADAARALREGAKDLEPDLALLSHADFENLGPSATERGRKSILAMQAALLQDTGGSGLTQGDIQALCVDGLNDLNMADHLLIQSVKTRRRGMAKIYTATAGGPEESFCDFLAEIYGGGDPQSQAPSQSATPSQASRAQDPASTDTEKDEPAPASPAPSSTADEDDLQARIGDCKVVFPSNPETLATSGVPADFISGRYDNGQYGCLYGDCDHKSSNRPGCATHIRRKHLGIALGCKFCPAKLFYKHSSWQDHMRAKHIKLPVTEWYLDPDLALRQGQAPGVPMEDLATRLAAPVVQRVVSETAPAPDSEPTPDPLAGTSEGDPPAPSPVKKEETRSGPEGLITALKLKRVKPEPSEEPAPKKSKPSQEDSEVILLSD